MKPIPSRPILLADDNEHDVDLTLRALRKARLANEVEAVHDGVEALDYLYCRGSFAGRSSGEPILVLLDLMMPRLDGREVLRAMKSDAQLKATPVVVLVSSSEHRELLREEALEYDGCVVKPVGFAKLLEVVQSVGLAWLLHSEALPPDSGRHAARRS